MHVSIELNYVVAQVTTSELSWNNFKIKFFNHLYTTSHKARYATNSNICPPRTQHKDRYEWVINGPIKLNQHNLTKLCKQIANSRAAFQLSKGTLKTLSFIKHQDQLVGFTSCLYCVSFCVLLRLARCKYRYLNTWSMVFA